MTAILSLVIACLISSIASQSHAGEWTSASKPGDGNVFTFRGAKIGDDFSALADHFWEERFDANSAKSKILKGLAGCSRYDDGYLLCIDRTLRDKTLGRDAIADIPVDSLMFKYLDKKLVGFDLSFPLYWFSNIDAMLASKYGPPHRTEKGLVTNQLGTRLENVVETWDTPHGPMTLTARGSYKIDVSELELLDRSAAAVLKQRDTEALAKKGKSAF